MPYEGNPLVLENLFRKKRLLEARDVEHCRYRPLILASSGVMRGVCGGAHAIALERNSDVLQAAALLEEGDMCTLLAAAKARADHDHDTEAIAAE